MIYIKFRITNQATLYQDLNNSTKKITFPLKKSPIFNQQYKSNQYLIFPPRHLPPLNLTLQDNTCIGYTRFFSSI